MKPLITFFLLFLAVTTTSHAFVNLDFEEGTIEPSRNVQTDPLFPVPYWTAELQPTTVVLPGWQTFLSGDEVAFIRAFDEQAVDGPRFGTLSPGPTLFHTRLDDGSIKRVVSMFAQSVAPLPSPPEPFPFPGLTPAEPPFDGAFSMGIRQTGFIPSDAKTLVLDGLFGPGATFEVQLGDSPPQLFAFANQWPGEEQTELSIDVSAFAGQEVELALRQVNGYGTLTELRFLPIPEPSAFSLFAVAFPGLLIAFRR